MILVNPFISFPGGGGGGGSYDTDAQAFFTAAGITVTGQKDAVNQLVLDFKAASLWAKILAFYPFVGGDATKHSFNLKDPTAFQIGWSGTVTHDANGITGNGADGFGDTSFNGNALSLENDSHLSIYSRTSAQDPATDIGAYNGSNAFWALNSRNAGDKFTVGSYRFTADGFILVTNTDGSGLYMESRVSSSAVTAYKNGASVGTDTTTSQPMPSAGVNILRHTGSGSYSAANFASASMGHSFTDPEAADFYTAVQTFQTALSRNV